MCVWVGLSSRYVGTDLFSLSLGMIHPIELPTIWPEPLVPRKVVAKVGVLTSALLAFLYLPNYLPTYLPRYNFERNRCGAEFCFCVLLILCLVRLRSNAK